MSVTTTDRRGGDGVLSTLRRAGRHGPALLHGVGTTLLLAVAGAAGLLAAPLLLQQVVDAAVTAGGLDPAAVLRDGAVAGAVALVGAVANRTATVRMLTATAEGLAQLRVRAVDHLHRLAPRDVAGERRGSMLARVTSDVDAVSNFMGWGGVGFVVGGVRVVATLAAIAFVAPLVLLVLAPALVAYTAGLLGAQRVLQRVHDRVREDVATSTSIVAEAVAGLPAIRTTGTEGRTRGRVAEAVERQRRAETRAAVLGAALFSSAELFAAVLTAGTVAAGVLLVDGIGVGGVLAVVFLVTLLLDPVQTMVETIHEAQAAAAGLRRVVTFLERPVDPDPVAPRALPDGPLGVRVDRVSFAYADRPTLADVDLHLPAGTTTALVGATGSGKTTLARMLVRLLRPDAGRVLLGGVPVDALAEADLRDAVAHVPQEGFLFDATLAENLRYGGHDASVDDLHGAVDALGLGGWLDDLPNGLDTVLGERGAGLSAGERQLVGLVRASLAQPRVLVLDEATSAVDPALEVALREAVDRLTVGRTVVTVAHRLSTAEAADLVVVLDEGRVVEVGPHAALVGRGGTYASLHADWTRGTTSAG